MVTSPFCGENGAQGTERSPAVGLPSDCSPRRVPRLPRAEACSPRVAFPSSRLPLSDEGQRWPLRGRRGLLAAPFLSSRVWPSEDSGTLSARLPEAAGTRAAGCAPAHRRGLGSRGPEGGRAEPLLRRLLPPAPPGYFRDPVAVTPEDSAAGWPRGPSLQLSRLCGLRQPDLLRPCRARPALPIVVVLLFYSNRARDAKRK